MTRLGGGEAKTQKIKQIATLPAVILSEENDWVSFSKPNPTLRRAALHNAEISGEKLNKILFTYNTYSPRLWGYFVFHHTRRGVY